MSTPFHSSSNTTPDAPTGTSNVAIVTGASSGIGLEVTKRLAAKGYRVVANSRNITSAMTLQATGDLKLVDGDIGLPETAQRVVAAAMRDLEAAGNLARPGMVLATVITRRKEQRVFERSLPCAFWTVVTIARLRIMRAALLWAACAVLANLARCAERIPMPDTVPAGTICSCDIQEVVNENTVSVKDLKRPKLSWVLRVFTNNWKGSVLTFDTKKKAYDACDRFGRAVDAEARKEQKQEAERAR